ncbi:Flp family type IVb pilin [Temperatibacter marinus]|uniref:Flp family type IVb pilin n=1 Tax=Temperatibacter marinus TaxID=1456591 RepID=A0AA52EHK0_9PROT|nr:Flp family type IVb pilin [Temperatibacter marinus]WND02652.1 Flp family type IVb pilin [Temperatibacter marinus]
MIKLLRKFRKSEEGATAIEYGLIAALIAIALITALTNMGDALSTFFGGVETTLEATPTDGS